MKRREVSSANVTKRSLRCERGQLKWGGQRDEEQRERAKGSNEHQDEKQAERARNETKLHIGLLSGVLQQ